MIASFPGTSTKCGLPQSQRSVSMKREHIQVRGSKSTIPTLQTRAASPRHAYLQNSSHSRTVTNPVEKEMTAPSSSSSPSGMIWILHNSLTVAHSSLSCLSSTAMLLTWLPLLHALDYHCYTRKKTTECASAVMTLLGILKPSFLILRTTPPLNYPY